MKKRFSKVLSLLVAVVIVLSMVQLPVMAASDIWYYNDFDVDYTQGAAKGNNSAGGDSTYIYMYNYAGGKDGGRKSWFYNYGATTEYVARDGGLAMKVTTPTTNNTSKNPVFQQILPSLKTLSSDKYFHIGFDFMVEDKNQNRDVYLNNISKTILTIGTDGKIKLFSKEACTYDINTWYNVDMYYDMSDNYKWYLFINDTFITTTTESTLRTFDQVKYNIYTPSVAGVYYLDSFYVGEETELPSISNEPETNEISYIKSSFDGLIAGEKIGGTPNTPVNGGKEADMYQGYYVLNEVSNDYDTTGVYIYDGDNYNEGASHKIITRDDNTAVEITVDEANEAALAPQVTIGDGLNVAPNGDAALIHLGFDINRKDTSCAVSLYSKTNGSAWNYDIMSFTEDNKIKFLNQYVCDYAVDTWYNIDIYYSNTTGKWYLYINDTFAKAHLRGLGLEVLDLFRLTWASPASTETVVRLDNIELSDISGAVKLTQNSAAVTNSKFTTGNLSAECKIISEAVTNPAIIIAKYADDACTELVEAAVGTYSDNILTATLNVEELTGTVKVFVFTSEATLVPLTGPLTLTPAQ